jgi:hypothetical protein
MRGRVASTDGHGDGREFGGWRRRVPQNAHLGEFDPTRSLEMPLVIFGLQVVYHRSNTHNDCLIISQYRQAEVRAFSLLRLQPTIRNVRYTVLNDAQHTYDGADGLIERTRADCFWATTRARESNQIGRTKA